MRIKEKSSEEIIPGLLGVVEGTREIEFRRFYNTENLYDIYKSSLHYVQPKKRIQTSCFYSEPLLPHSTLSPERNQLSHSDQNL